MIILVNGIEYSFPTTLPAFVQHAVRLLTDKWGLDFNDPIAPYFAKHKMRLLAERWGVPHP